MSQDRKTIYFVAGEASGDNHGAALLRSLREVRPDVHFIGRGGPQMKAIAGAQFHDWIDRAAVVGLWDVLRNYGFFRKQFQETLSAIEQEKPDAVVLIDYPGFNLRLARALHASGRTHRSSGKTGVPKLIYYISPQVWAWNRRRITQMARWLDLMLCIFPFEADLYNKSGLRTIFVGHPMMERLAAQKIKTSRDPNLVALFPGSRRREVRKIFPIMLETMRKLVSTHPDLQFEVGAASDAIAEEVRQESEMAPDLRARIHVRMGDAASLMQRAFAGIVASGSATLEAAYFRLPFVLVYKVAWLTYVPGRIVVRVNYLGMPNVLANRAVVPEFIQHEAKPSALAGALLELLEKPEQRARMMAEFDQIISSLGEGGASRRAAQAMIEELDRSS